MGRRGDGYGSEDHLRRYIADERAEFDRAVARAIGTSPSVIEWLDFPRTKTGDREFQRLEFLRGTPDDFVLEPWKSFWPPRGRGQTWDLVGRAGGAWLLVEAKASWPEFVTTSCGAKGDGLTTIRKALERTKRDLGVHRRFDWTATYYQHANRIAALWFLAQQGVRARLVEIHFLSDVFPDDTPCPRTKRDWESLIEARRLTMGLPKRHSLSRREHHVFLPALSKAKPARTSRDR